MSNQYTPVEDSTVKPLSDKILKLCGSEIDKFMSANMNGVYDANDSVKMMYEILKKHVITCLSYEILLLNPEFDKNVIKKPAVQDIISKVMAANLGLIANIVLVDYKK